MSNVSLYAGTSAGSFIAMALGSGLSASTLLELFTTQAATVFTPNPNISGSSVADFRARLAALAAEVGGAQDAISTSSIWGDILKYLGELTNALYTNTGLESVLADVLPSGGTQTLAQLSASVLAATLQLDTAANIWSPVVLTNLPGSTTAGIHVAEAALCSGAAPTYFPPYDPASLALGFCADGGLFANNPSLMALGAVVQSGAAVLDDVYLLSLDTGTTPDSMPGAVINGSFGGPLSMGAFQWMFPISVTSGSATMPKYPLLSAMMDSVSASIATNAAILLGSRFFRVSVPLPESVALDDTSAAARAVMDGALDRYFDSSVWTDLTNWLSSNFP